jgi:hypothetical protein
VADEPAGDAPDPVTERVKLCVAEFWLVVEGKEAGPGCEVGGDVRGEDPSLVDLLGLAGKVARPMALAVRTPSVSTVSRMAKNAPIPWRLPVVW